MISSVRVVSLEAVRETRTMLNPARASWSAYSLPSPSEAPVTIAQLPLGPNERSYVGDQYNPRNQSSDIVYYRRTDFPGRMNKLARTLAKVQALETINQPPAASNTEAATLCQPGAKFHSQWESEYVISFTNSMASDCPFDPSKEEGARRASFPGVFRGMFAQPKSCLGSTARITGLPTNPHWDSTTRALRSFGILKKRRQLNTSS